MDEEGGKLDTRSNGESVQLTEVQALNDRLDRLWITYLNTLDSYQQAQAQLQCYLSSGFLHLAQANRSAQSGRRYGSDWYDDRMKASRRVRLSYDGRGRFAPHGAEDASASVPGVAIIDRAKASKENRAATDDSKAKESPVLVQQPSPPTTPSSETLKTEAAEPSSPSSQTSPERSANDLDGAEKRAKRARAAKASQARAQRAEPKTAEQAESLRNPLTWFGILVPPALRQAQDHFVAAAGDPVADAVNAARGLRAMEVEIRKVRKGLRKAEREMA